MFRDCWFASTLGLRVVAIVFFAGFWSGVGRRLSPKDGGWAFCFFRVRLCEGGRFRRELFQVAIWHVQVWHPSLATFVVRKFGIVLKAYARSAFSFGGLCLVSVGLGASRVSLLDGHGPKFGRTRHGSAQVPFADVLPSEFPAPDSGLYFCPVDFWRVCVFQRMKSLFVTRRVFLMRVACCTHSGRLLMLRRRVCFSREAWQVRRLFGSWLL